MANTLKLSLTALLSAPFTLSYTLPDGTGRLPALGWNSWNAYACDVNADKILSAAHALVDKGFLAAGYDYVIQDDCWSVERGRSNATYQLLPNTTKFPDGIKGIADHVHALGLKYGVYSSAGLETCGGYPASLGYEGVDAATFAEWGVDYLKYDNCGVPDYWYPNCTACNPDPSYGGPVGANGTCVPGSEQFSYGPLCDYQWPVDGRNYSRSLTALRFRTMQHALARQNRSILFSLCEWGTDEVWTWANTTGQSWRMSNDIFNDWESVARILNMNSFLSNYAGFGGHNDVDMLEVGNGVLTDQEDRTHFAMWALMKSPLLIGAELGNLTERQVGVLQNRYLLSFNQDEVYGKPAAPYKWGCNPDWTYDAKHPAEFWSGASSRGTMVAMVNTLNHTRTMTAEFSEVPELGAGSYHVVDVWTGKQMGCMKKRVEMTLEAHDTAVLLVGMKCS
ncbi:uncharacterized protein LTR77_000961 [Saxophila tyrrhenica]|uniref:Alpha-galactosidase n=1 Tax=Saxophila tyrrhenica TaxID=1690608 RepID=A0AAV9PPY9_9PEZI|nr:hypothetical protein LTR77_000961 [Saxophila tyrrhenica]